MIILFVFVLSEDEFDEEDDVVRVMATIGSIVLGIIDDHGLGPADDIMEGIVGGVLGD